MGKFALLIGVGESRVEDLPALPSAVEDIRAMEAVLLNPDLGGFDSVEILPNPTRQVMEEAIETLFANRKQEDLVLFYFSGHGILDERGKLYLVTPETRKNRGELVKTTAVAARILQDNMSDSRSKRQVLILDACYSGAVVNGMTVKSAGRKVDIQEELGGEGRAILTSSSALEESFHVEGYDLSIYTHYLIEGIQTGNANQDGGEYITVKELHRYVVEKLEQAAFEMHSRFKMSPQFVPVREGSEIRLVRSSKLRGDQKPRENETNRSRIDYTEIILKRDGRGRDLIWEVDIWESSSSSNKYSILIGRGETISLKVPATKSYAMKISFLEYNETSYLGHGLVSSSRGGDSNKWKGLLLPGKYYFSCGVKSIIDPRSLLNLSLAILSRGGRVWDTLYLKFEYYEDFDGKQIFD